MPTSKPKRQQKWVRRDWHALRTEYVQGRETLRDLAERRGIPQSVLNEHSSAENWPAERAAFRAGASEQVLTAAMKTRATSELAIDAATYKVSARVLSKLEQAAAEEVASDPAALCRIMKATHDAYRMLRETAGLPPRKQPAPVEAEDEVFVFRRCDPSGRVVERVAGSKEGYKPVDTDRPDAGTMAVPPASDADPVPDQGPGVGEDDDRSGSD